MAVATTSAGPQAVFSSTRGLLFVLLPREIRVLDLELGVPAGACAGRKTALPMHTQDTADHSMRQHEAG